MVHKSNIIPGLSKFIDTNILSHYPPTSIKRIAAAGAIAIYLNQNMTVVDKILQHPMVEAMNLVNDQGMVNIEILRDVYKNEINKVGFLRMHLPLLGDVDFTSDDLDSLYRILQSLDATSTSAAFNQ
jgi:hypothetical protein